MPQWFFVEIEHFKLGSFGQIVLTQKILNFPGWPAAEVQHSHGPTLRGDANSFLDEFFC